jgi:phosphatidylglycerol:prolipoprotein diacylglycerol transferase
LGNYFFAKRFVVRSTLFLIPHEIFGWPLFGVGLALAALVAGLVAWACWTFSRQGSLANVAAGLPVALMAAVVIVFVLPAVEMRLPDGTPVGLPIRGYGVMVLLGLLAGIGISVYRGNQLGVDADKVIGLGFWMMLGGVLGARTFFVVQKWDEDFAHLEFASRLVAIVKLTEGGLVIYGGVLGGLLAGMYYCYQNKLRMLATADLIAPGFLIGLSLGRIGCLLHGCCFGGVCTEQLPAIQFPHGSGPYQSQLASGRLLGVHLRNPSHPPAVIDAVDKDSPADKMSIAPGQTLDALDVGLATDFQPDPVAPPRLTARAVVNEKTIRFSSEQLPDRSLPVHPSQVYASINALLLCLLIWLFQPVPQHDGIAFLAAVGLYAVSRYLLEGIRSDEAGQLGTTFTIAQLVSLASGFASIIGIIVISRLPAGRAWKWSRN